MGNQEDAEGDDDQEGTRYMYHSFFSSFLFFFFGPILFCSLPFLGEKNSKLNYLREENPNFPIESISLFLLIYYSINLRKLKLL